MSLFDIFIAMSISTNPYDFMKKNLLILFAICFVAFSCQSTNKVPEKIPQSVELITPQQILPTVGDTLFKLPFDLSTYDKMFPLSNKLIEISGLSYNAKSQSFVAVNDEQGHLFLLNDKDMSIEKTIDFGGNGDYEGVEIVGDMAFISKSTGTIYTYDITNDVDGINYKTALSATNDVEGLTKHPNKNGLVLACKGRAYLENTQVMKKVKSFYYFDLNDKVLDETPILSVYDTVLIEKVSQEYADQDLSAAAFKKLLSRIKDFSPSGLAYHPIDQNLYIISSVGKTMIVVSPNGEVIRTLFLDDNIHTQPEGICFDKIGNLFISNEGKGLVAKIYKYNYKAH